MLWRYLDDHPDLEQLLMKLKLDSNVAVLMKLAELAEREYR